LALVKLSASRFGVSAYGAASLLLGLQALARGLALNPLLNLAIYATPQEGKRQGLGWVYQATVGSIWFLGLLSLPFFAFAIPALRIQSGNLPLALLLLGALLLSEALKTARLNLLHCRDYTRAFALWTVADASSKPALLLLALILPLPRTALLLLAAQLAGSLLTLLATEWDPRLSSLRKERSPQAPPPSSLHWILDHRAFLLPLVALGITGWVTGVSDRYLVNYFLGAAPAGIYAGIYAIFGTSFMPLNAVFILSLRPRLLSLEADGRRSAWRALLARGLAALAGTSFLAILTLYLLRKHLISGLLAPGFSAGLPAVPGILIGNAIIGLGLLLEQAFYIQHRTSLVLLKQLTGSLLAIVLVALAVPRWGIAGAGWACPVYAGLELMFGALILWQTQPARLRASH
jgi:O-antigen/teichoic acid export membrane protein